MFIIFPKLERPVQGSRHSLFFFSKGGITLSGERLANVANSPTFLTNVGENHAGLTSVISLATFSEKGSGRGR